MKLNPSIPLVGCKLFSKIILAFFVLMMQAPFGFTQLVPLEVSPNLSSGILQSIDSNADQASDLGIVQIKILDFDYDKAQFLLREFNKYSGEIVGYGYSVIDQKIIVSFTNPMYPNFILAIMKRSNIIGYYAHNGVNIYYQKDGRSAFIR